MQTVTNVTVSMRIPLVNNEGTGLNLLKKLQALPYPTADGKACEELGIVVSNSWSLPCNVVAIHVTYSREKGTLTEMPLYADVVVELTPTVYEG